MQTTEQTVNGWTVVEKRMSYAECREIYGTHDVQDLNRRFDESAQRATDGNGHQYAVYANGEILIVTEC